MGKHTPGPWWLSSSTIVCTPLAQIIANVTPCGIQPLEVPFAEAVANASLIAAAPELLEALKWMVENDETNEGDVPMPEHNGMTWNEINEFWIAGLNRARAAIAKAEGA